MSLPYPVCRDGADLAVCLIGERDDYGYWPMPDAGSTWYIDGARLSGVLEVREYPATVGSSVGSVRRVVIVLTPPLRVYRDAADGGRTLEPALVLKEILLSLVFPADKRLKAVEGQRVVVTGRLFQTSHQSFQPWLMIIPVTTLDGGSDVDLPLASPSAPSFALARP